MTARRSGASMFMSTVVTLVLALVATACGGSGGGAGSLDPETSAAAIAAAEGNEGRLTLTDRIASSELLDTADGSIRTLPDVVTGDRAVLVWYWAPH